MLIARGGAKWIVFDSMRVLLAVVDAGSLSAVRRKLNWV